MSLKDYNSPNLLNNGVYASMKQEPDASTKSGTDFDKRYDEDKLFDTKLSEYKGYADTISNALGTRSPYYTIGEIQSTELGQFASKYLQDGLGNMVRAVTSAFDALNGSGQDGVIIDGFGTITGNIGVEFTKNPIIFSGSQITDGRMRTPNTVKMTVYVSNYYNDNIGGMAVDYLTSQMGEWSKLASEAASLLINGGNTRAQEALYNLRWLQEQGKPFTLYTPHGVYENMLIQTLAPKTNDKNVDMLECDITFMEMIMYEPYLDTQSATPARTNIVQGNTFLGEVIEDGESIIDAASNISWTNIQSSFAKIANLWGDSGTATTGA